MSFNAKTSLNDMLISASFRYGQLKSIKNQSHPHFRFDTHIGSGKDKKINWIKLQRDTYNESSSWGAEWFFQFSLFQFSSFLLCFREKKTCKKSNFIFSGWERKKSKLRNFIPNIYTYLISLNGSSEVSYVYRDSFIKTSCFVRCWNVKRM